MPLEHSWITRARSENFAGLVDYTDELQPGARRFDMGEFAQFTMVPMAIAALTQIAGVGRRSHPGDAVGADASDRGRRRVVRRTSRRRRSIAADT